MYIVYSSISLCTWLGVKYSAQSPPARVSSTNDREESDDDNGQTDITLSQTQDILVSASAKYATLCGLAIVFTNIQFLCHGIYWLVQNFSTETSTMDYRFSIVLTIWFCLVLFVQFYTIYLSFPSANKHYDTVCGAFHKLFASIFGAYMIKEMQKEYKMSAL